MYHLGSLIVFLFARVHINALIMDNLSIIYIVSFSGQALIRGVAVHSSCI